MGWLESAISGVTDGFAQKADALLKDHMADVLYATPAFRRWIITGMLRSAAGVTGLEIIRRIMGMAKVKDITAIGDEKARVLAERGAVYAAKAFIKEDSAYGIGEAYLKTLWAAYERAAANEDITRI